MFMDLFSTLQLLHEAVMSVLVTTIYGRWRGTITETENSKLYIRKVKGIVLLLYSATGIFTDFLQRFTILPPPPPPPQENSRSLGASHHLEVMGHVR